MAFKFCRVISLFALISIARAQSGWWLIYSEDFIDGTADKPTTPTNLFSFFYSVPDCDDVNNAPVFDSLSDLSYADGVRCIGCGAGSGTSVNNDVTLMEWDVGDDYEWGHHSSLNLQRALFFTSPPGPYCC